MSEYDNTNRGQIWGNDQKKSDNHPDFKGSVNVEGVEYWVSAWKRKEGSNPKAPALRFSLTPKEAQAPAPQAAQADAPSDDDIPF